MRVIERGAIRVSKAIAELAAFVNGARCLRCRVTRYSTGEGELLKKTTHSIEILLDRRIDLAVSPFEISISHHTGTAMAGAADIDDVEVASLDDPIEVDIDEIESGRRTPVSQQPRLDVLRFQGLLEQWVIEQINLSYREIIRSTPIGIDTRQFLPIHDGRSFGPNR